MSIYKKLNSFKENVGKVRKDANNPFHKNKYATIESVLDTIENPLKESELGFIQCVEDMHLVTTIYDVESDDKITSKVPLILAKNDMQQLGSAITYARRYALVSMFGLEQEDDDGNKASGYDKPKQQAKPQIKQQSETPVRNYTIGELKDLAEVKAFDLSIIEKAYDKQLSLFTQGQLNGAYAQLLKK